MKFPHQPLRFLATLALCMVILALPLLSPTRVQAAVDTNWVDGSSGGGSWYATEVYRARTTESVSVRPYTVTIFDTPMYRTTELILGGVPGITVTADIMQKDPKYVQELNRKSAIAGINNVIVAMYANPPADLALWIQDTGQTLGFLPKQAYAQGVGFSGLAPLLPIWRAFRNIAYLLLAIVMIVIGFMVMLRKKIDPKTVVTVQNAIPRIVLTLLLITFSYAIVGIMIDLMYVTILLAVTIFKSSGLLPDPKWALQLFGYKTPEALYAQGGLLENFVNIDVSPWQLFGLNLSGWKASLATLGALTVGTLLAAGGFLLTGPIGTIPGGILAFGIPLMSLLIALAMLFLFIRLFVFFASTYIQIILAVLFSPVQLLFEAIPGNNSFSNWFKNLLSNVVVFPVAAIIFMLSAIFAKFANEGGDLWNPPYSPLFSSVTAISAVISLGLLFAIPTIAGQIKELLKAKPFIQAGPEGIAGAVSHPTMLAWQIGQFFLSHRQMGEIAKAVKATPPSGDGEAK